MVKESRLSELRESFKRHGVRGQSVGLEEFASELAAVSKQLATTAERGLETSPQAPHHHDHDQAAHHFSSLEVPLPDHVAKGAFSRLLRDLPVEVIRAKGLVRFLENPEELFVFQ
jgi:G3E family GTPase